MRAAASALNLNVKPIAEVTQASELNRAFSVIADSKPDAMLVIADRSLLAKRADRQFCSNSSLANHVPVPRLCGRRRAHGLCAG
jgi:hypothetical protein